MSLFGKGFGECVVIHVGDGHYVIVDSFINNATKNPIAEDYLNSLGVSIDSIDAIVSTHWHSDHVAGLYRLLKNANGAKFITYPIISEEKFNEFIEFGKMNTEQSSTNEFASILQMIVDDERQPVFASHNKLIYNRNSTDTSFGKSVMIFALSPQDEDLKDYLLNLNIPSEKTMSYSFPDDNDISIVLWVQVGDNVILLGGDLEQKEKNSVGWKAVIANHTLPGKAEVFKVPHHGSQNAHNADVWTKLLVDKPISIMTVFNRSAGLPKDSDKDRITQLSSRTFIAGADAKKVKDFRKLENKFNFRLASVPQNVGVIRLRKNITSTKSDWQVETFGPTEELSVMTN